ncbi:hypothetical protein CHELA40_12064 [Chelatococcus asaccharovorans]|nr:hypothetical protein CHELA40_12064 [Chelatococcus asaccharovorans]CAH1683519.1 hypothetical protein CHELA17_63540 [Chelatococcus asaccharovorans]
MVLLRHLHPPDTGLGANVGVKKTTSKLLVLVELLNLTFDLELDVRRDSNVKFAPLEHFRVSPNRENAPCLYFSAFSSREPVSTSLENALVVRLRHLHPPDTGLGANVGVKRTTSKLLVLVELMNLTFDLELDIRRDSNVKFAPLGQA